jgi:EKC/KEOPS complex subunit CGI121/TPRKB
MTTFNLPCPFQVDPVHVFFFTEVLNAIELKSRLLAGDAEYLYAFLDTEFVNPSCLRLADRQLPQIVSQLQLLAAVNRVLHDNHHGLMRTKHVHSEIVYALAATQNVPSYSPYLVDMGYRSQRP